MNARTSAGFGAGSFLTLLLGPSFWGQASAAQWRRRGAPARGYTATACRGQVRAGKPYVPANVARPCGSSDWRFVLQADGSWQATESGCANATGIARYDGTAVNLEFQYSGGAGRYIWPLDAQCRGLTGTVTWTQGPLTGQTVASTLALVQ